MPKKGEYVKFKFFLKKLSPFIIYANVESLRVSEDNGKQNSNESLLINIKNMLLAVMVIK